MSTEPLFVDEQVRWGFWLDHDVGRHRFLVPNSKAPYIYATIIFFIGLSTLNIAFIVKQLLHRLQARAQRAIEDYDARKATKNKNIRTPDATNDDEEEDHNTEASPLLDRNEHGGSSSSAPTCQASMTYNTVNSGSPADVSSSTYPTRNQKPTTPTQNEAVTNAVRNSNSTVVPQGEGSTNDDGAASGKVVPNTPLVLSRGGREATKDVWKYISNPRNPHKTWMVICYIILNVVRFGVIVLGVMATRLMESGQSALWYSDKCGIWEFPTDNATHEEATRADVVLRKKEARAGEYAKYCYQNAEEQPLPVYCNFFARRNVEYEETRPWGCPFNMTICKQSQVVEFDTGIRPASDLGINTRNPYKFRRKATCVPLNVDEPFVKRIDEDDEVVFWYYYGKWAESEDAADTPFYTLGKPFNWTSGTYDLMVASYSSEDDDYWTPIDELNPGPGRRLTLFFIRPLQIYYVQPSGDPVFPTNRQLKLGGTEYFVKDDPKARVLACVEETLLCDPTGDHCWPLQTEADDPILDRAYWLMKEALKGATMYHAIYLRLGTALVAQDMISQQTSLQLVDGHWVNETRRLFDTSLALGQIRAWSISSGEDSWREESDGWVDQTPMEVTESGGLCGLLKINSRGYTDIDVIAALLLILLPWPLSAILSTRWVTLCSIPGAMRRFCARQARKMMAFGARVASGIRARFRRKGGKTGRNTDEGENGGIAAAETAGGDDSLPFDGGDLGLPRYSAGRTNGRIPPDNEGGTAPANGRRENGSLSRVEGGAGEAATVGDYNRNSETMTDRGLDTANREREGNVSTAVVTDDRLIIEFLMRMSR